MQSFFLFEENLKADVGFHLLQAKKKGIVFPSSLAARAWLPGIVSANKYPSWEFEPFNLDR